MAAVTRAAAAATVVLALLDWAAVAGGRRRVEWWTKPLTMVALIATVLLAGGLDDAPGRWLVVALVLGLVGDLALLGDTEGRLLSGVAAFFGGHLGYLVAFASLGLSPSWWSPLVVVVLAATSWPTRAVVPAAWRHGGARLAVPLAAYTLVIAAMTALAFLTGEPLLAVGATLFVVSDSLIALGLARNDFAQEQGGAHLAVMVTYHLSQALLAVGILLAR